MVREYSSGLLRHASALGDRTGLVSHTPAAIAVPVRNEAERLPRFLSALARQVNAPAFDLCLFFDNCDDGSEPLATGMLQRRLPFRMHVDRVGDGAPPNAGLARARAMQLAVEAAPSGIVLTTDADGEPAPDWVAANLRALKRADVVAGRIERTPGRASPMQDRLEAYYDRLHALRRLLDPVPWEDADTHHWTSAASLGMRAEIYRALGGFAPLAAGEDAAFADAAARAGYRLRRDRRVAVRTSARRHGRAAHGFAATLAAFDGTAAMPLVHHPADEAWRYGLHARARRAHGGATHTLANLLRIPAAEVEDVALECRNGEAFAARLVGAPPGGMRTVPLAQAETLLAALEPNALEGAA